MSRTVKALLKLRLSYLALFPWNLKNYKPSTEKTKDLIFIKFRNFHGSSQRPSIKYVRKIYRKTNISKPLIRTRIREKFLESFAYVLNGWPLTIIGLKLFLKNYSELLMTSSHWNSGKVCLVSLSFKSFRIKTHGCRITSFLAGFLHVQSQLWKHQNNL